MAKNKQPNLIASFEMLSIGFIKKKKIHVYMSVVDIKVSKVLDNGVLEQIPQ